MLDLPNSSIWNFLQCLFGLNFFLAPMCWSISRGASVQKNNMLNENSSFRKCIGGIRKQLYSTLQTDSKNSQFFLKQLTPIPPERSIHISKRRIRLHSSIWKFWITENLLCSNSLVGLDTHFAEMEEKKHPIPIELRQRGGELDMQGGENYNARRYYRRTTLN